MTSTAEDSNQSSSSSTSGTPALTLNDLRDLVFEWAQSKGWWEDEANRNIPSKLALVHSEVSEALEEYREGRMDTYFTYTSGPNAEPSVQFAQEPNSMAMYRRLYSNWKPVTIEDMVALGYDAKPEGFASEIADVFIRLADLCGYLDIDIEKEVRLKMEYNHTRSYRHGGKKV